MECLDLVGTAVGAVVCVCAINGVVSLSDTIPLSLVSKCTEFISNLKYFNVI
jgi:hypothetical protein